MRNFARLKKNYNFNLILKSNKIMYAKLTYACKVDPFNSYILIILIVNVYKIV